MIIGVLCSMLLLISRLVDKIKIPTVCMATASPAKFPEAVKAAGIEMKPDPRLGKLFSSPTCYKEMKKGEDWDGIIRGVIGEIRERRDKFAKGCNDELTVSGKELQQR